MCSKKKKTGNAFEALPLLFILKSRVTWNFLQVTSRFISPQFYQLFLPSLKYVKPTTLYYTIVLCITCFNVTKATRWIKLFVSWGCKSQKLGNEIWLTIAFSFSSLILYFMGVLYVILIQEFSVIYFLLLMVVWLVIL